MTFLVLACAGAPEPPPAVPSGSYEPPGPAVELGDATVEMSHADSRLERRPWTLGNEDGLVWIVMLPRDSTLTVHALDAVNSLDDIVLEGLGSTGIHGAGLRIDGGSLALSEALFLGNTAYSGGAIYAEGDATLTIRESEFSIGWAYYGAAIYLESGTLDIEDSEAEDNYAYYYGGSVYTEDRVQVTLTRVDFENNGGYATHGTALYVGADSTLAIEGGSFHGNIADAWSSYYGTLYLHDGVSATLDSVDFTENQAVYGAGIYGYNNNTITLTNVSFDDNYAYYGSAVPTRTTRPTTAAPSMCATRPS